MRSARLRAAVASAVFVGGACLARNSDITLSEVRCFRKVNDLPERIFVPAWIVMQLGSLGGALVASAVVALVVDRGLGRKMAVAGSTTWLGAKAVKPFIRRGRPVGVVHAPRVLGRVQTGLGYPSGHAAVAASLAAVAARRVPAPWRAGVWASALLVGPTRMYVGAHLPLDIVGGVALGLLVASTVG